ncbi:condensin-2 complex subunit H2 [Stigmatopora nigra]
MESKENRYAHLLNPIRELTKNWAVDVAAELNDYLKELDTMCVTFDDGETQLNFAEAALLIQASTCIYSKKVELLHNLVYQTLEYIREDNKRRNQKAAAAAAAGGDQAAANWNDDEDEDQFQEVDAESLDCMDERGEYTFVKVVPLPPAALIPPQHHEKLKFPLISAKGEVEFSQKDFRINIFVPGPDGLIRLVPPVRKDSLLQSAIDQSQAPMDDQPNDVEDDGGNDMGFPDDDNDDVDPPGLDEHIQRQLASRREQVVPVELVVAAAAPEEQEEDHVWALHDPYAVLQEGKPFKSGKCHRVPDGLDDEGKRKRQGEPLSLANFRTWLKETYDPPERKLHNGPTSIDLNDKYREERKRRMKKLQKKKKKRGLSSRDPFGAPSDSPPDDEAQENQADYQFHQPDLQGDDDDDDNEPEAGDDLTPPDAEEPDYEALVRLRLETMTKNCEEYRQTTSSTRRFQAWEEKIRSKLLEQEKRPTFDIHDYGDRVVSALGELGGRRSFASVVSGAEDFEACRFLLASLQLANDSAVAVDSREGLEASLDSAELMLLSKDRAADRLKHFPALQNQQHHHHD